MSERDLRSQHGDRAVDTFSMFLHRRGHEGGKDVEDALLEETDEHAQQHEGGRSAQGR